MRKPCCEGTNKGAWSREEDQKLIDYIQAHGEGSCNWRSLPNAAGLHRSGKSCRLRWINYLQPDIKHGNFGQDEEDLIVRLHALLGNRWSLIAGRLPGRTDKEIENYWNSHIRGKLIKMGIDPNNHKINQSHRVLSDASAPSSSGSVNIEHKETAMVSSSSSAHHLSLDLTIAFPSPTQLALMDDKPKPTNDHELTNSTNTDNESAPTLLLFR